MEQIKPKADFLIEVLHEVANPIGGVYTVVATKSVEMRKYYNNFWAIGAYYPQYAKNEFEEKPLPSDIKTVFEELSKENIFCHYGIWLIPGKPKTILVDYSKRIGDLPKIKKKLKQVYGIDAKDCGSNLDKQIVWSYCVSKLFEKFLSLREFKKKLGVVHFHLSDPGLFLLDLAKRNPYVGIVYTAHSTRLGRYIAMNKEDLTREIRENKNKVVEKGREYKYGGMVKTVHQFEEACVKAADIFTSVSEVTAKEANYILGRKPDIITPNGLDMSSFPSLEERAIIHHNAKNRIYRFLNAYFSPYYPIDVKDSLLFYTVGRYELVTKGYDIFIEALGKLNKRLKQEHYKKDIFVFLFIKISNKEPNEDVLENLAVYEAIEHEIEKEFPHIKNKVMNSLIHGQDIKHKTIFDESFLINTRKLMVKFTQQKNKLPHICAFKGMNKDDPLLKLISDCGLKNRADDKIKIIFYPTPISIADGLLCMEFDYLIAGMHLGVFPSLYEPWGYTPLEAAANGIMTITTDAAGFGRFVLRNTNKKKKQGIYVLHAEGRKHNQIVNELTDIMHSVALMPRTERIQRKLEAYNTASLADWKEFAKYYIKAHNMAVERCKAR